MKLTVEYKNLLEEVIDEIGEIVVAVSGGVDSMTLAHIAHARLGISVEMFHALSPAVPSRATQRIKRHAKSFGWQLKIVNAGEMQDSRYLENPINRCFFCKTNLYSKIAALTDKTIVSGANIDDLSDFRPGLTAAASHKVRHPYIEAKLGKQHVRSIASLLKLNDLVELPASPCLSSRIETGIAVTEERLSIIQSVEVLLEAELGPGTIRCRIRKGGVVIELGSNQMKALKISHQNKVIALLRQKGCWTTVNFELYKRGSAFLRN